MSRPPNRRKQPDAQAGKQLISKEAAFVKAAKLLWTPEAIKQVEDLAAELLGASNP